MNSEALLILRDVFFITFLLFGTLWLWGIIKFKPDIQEKWETVLQRSRPKFKLLFLAALIIVIASIIWKKYFL